MKKNGLKHTAAQGLTIILALMLMLALMPVIGEKALAEDETSFMSDNCIYIRLSIRPITASGWTVIAAMTES
ncbi:hypothetical protein [Hornefia butyriciproducens]|uniref:hypothetical protein n=1 Tax=Hornefia butyriciproducens TaxID=2652293 RepID=UPI002A918435|nr:hypothetical protein [Hornefia butyriciproducens]MDY5423358.1 hypothetical protein [Hornefia butyriciproducens]